jgi:hypothetical protein
MPLEADALGHVLDCAEALAERPRWAEMDPKCVRRARAELDALMRLARCFAADGVAIRDADPADVATVRPAWVTMP